MLDRDASPGLVTGCYRHTLVVHASRNPRAFAIRRRTASGRSSGRELRLIHSLILTTRGRAESGGGVASRSEIDAVDPMLGTRTHALVVASSEGHSPNTYLVPDATGFHHAAMDGAQNPDVRADMTFFETPGGGAVFSVGSIAWGASLPHHGYDNNVARISENVIRRFLEDAPFPMPDG